MPQLDYEILKVLPDGSALWMADTKDLQTARMRIAEFAKKSPGQYLVHDRRIPAKSVYELYDNAT
jgi:hypothetical protein